MKETADLDAHIRSVKNNSNGSFMAAAETGK
jgi:hypothetical protein